MKKILMLTLLSLGMGSIVGVRGAYAAQVPHGESSTFGFILPDRNKFNMSNPDERKLYSEMRRYVLDGMVEAAQYAQSGPVRKRITFGEPVNPAVRALDEKVHELFPYLLPYSQWDRVKYIYGRWQEPVQHVSASKYVILFLDELLRSFFLKERGMDFCRLGKAMKLLFEGDYLNIRDRDFWNKPFFCNMPMKCNNDRRPLPMPVLRLLVLSGHIPSLELALKNGAQVTPDIFKESWCIHREFEMKHPGSDGCKTAKTIYHLLLQASPKRQLTPRTPRTSPGPRVSVGTAPDATGHAAANDLREPMNPKVRELDRMMHAHLPRLKPYSQWNGVRQICARNQVSVSQIMIPLYIHLLLAEVDQSFFFIQSNVRIRNGAALYKVLELLFHSGHLNIKDRNFWEKPFFGNMPMAHSRDPRLLPTSLLRLLVLVGHFRGLELALKNGAQVTPAILDESTRICRDVLTKESPDSLSVSNARGICGLLLPRVAHPLYRPTHRRILVRMDTGNDAAWVAVNDPRRDVAMRY